MERQSGTLILGGVTFELDDCDDTKFYIFDSEEISPYICINEHKTHKSEIDETISGCLKYPER